jgi:hypothetical protein
MAEEELFPDEVEQKSENLVTDIASLNAATDPAVIADLTTRIDAGHTDLMESLAKSLGHAGDGPTLNLALSGDVTAQTSDVYQSFASKTVAQGKLLIAELAKKPTGWLEGKIGKEKADFIDKLGKALIITGLIAGGVFGALKMIADGKSGCYKVVTAGSDADSTLLQCYDGDASGCNCAALTAGGASSQLAKECDLFPPACSATTIYLYQTYTVSQIVDSIPNAINDALKALINDITSIITKVGTALLIVVGVALVMFIIYKVVMMLIERRSSNNMSSANKHHQS